MATPPLQQRRASTTAPYQPVEPLLPGQELLGNARVAHESIHDYLAHDLRGQFSWTVEEVTRILLERSKAASSPALSIPVQPPARRSHSFMGGLLGKVHW